MEEAAVGGEEADRLGVEDAVGFVVHTVGDEEGSEAGVDTGVVERVCRVALLAMAA